MPVEAIDVVVTSDNAVVPRVRFLSRLVGAVLGCRIDVDLVALLTTEVLSNAVREATGQVVAVFSMPDRLRVEVRDRSSATPRVLHPDPLDDGGHRGLMVVDELATAWGVEHRPVGKVVWFEVRAAPPFDDLHPRSTGATGEGTGSAPPTPPTPTTAAPGSPSTTSAPSATRPADPARRAGPLDRTDRHEDDAGGGRTRRGPIEVAVDLGTAAMAVAVPPGPVATDDAATPTRVPTDTTRVPTDTLHPGGLDTDADADIGRGAD